MARSSSVRAVFLGSLIVPLAVVGLGFTQAGGRTNAPATPEEVIQTYESLADAILAVKQTEANLVRSFLAAGYEHARDEIEFAQAATTAGDTKRARASAENAAALVAQLGSEGDNAVARVRKRLVEGGHHHNAEGEAQGIYDEGYVIVTKAAKKMLLEASRSIAQIAAQPDADALGKQWAVVKSAYESLKTKP
jgi:hypothetical protein